MSENCVWLRLVGDLPPSEELARTLGTTPTRERRRGMPILGGRYLQPADNWSITLIPWWSGPVDENVIARAVTTLQHMAPALASLDRTRCRVQLHISAVRNEEQGGFELPSELISAAGAARLELVVSILCDVSDEGNSGDEEDGQPVGPGSEHRFI